MTHGARSLPADEKQALFEWLSIWRLGIYIRLSKCPTSSAIEMINCVPKLAQSSESMNVYMVFCVTERDPGLPS